MWMPFQPQRNGQPVALALLRCCGLWCSGWRGDECFAGRQLRRGMHPVPASDAWHSDMLQRSPKPKRKYTIHRNRTSIRYTVSRSVTVDVRRLAERPEVSWSWVISTKIHHPPTQCQGSKLLALRRTPPATIGRSTWATFHIGTSLFLEQLDLLCEIVWIGCKESTQIFWPVETSRDFGSRGMMFFTGDCKPSSCPSCCPSCCPSWIVEWWGAHPVPSTILDKSATRRAWCVPVARHAEDPAFLIQS